MILLTDGKIKRMVRADHISWIEPYTPGDRGKGSGHVGCQVFTLSGWFICDETLDEVLKKMEAEG